MDKSIKIGKLITILLFGFISHTGTSCQSSELPINIQDGNDMVPNGKKIIIQVGSRSFDASLTDNAAVDTLLSMLPLTLEMEDLNRNEKFARLSQNLPTQTFKPGTIRNGDLLLWGSNTFVIFYETFSSTYSYTRLGKVDDPTGLKDALGSGNISIKIKMSSCQKVCSQYDSL